MTNVTDASRETLARHSSAADSLRMGEPGLTLLIDDENAILEELVEKLGANGLSCMTASSAQQGLEVLRDNHAIEVVVTDIRMPGMDGLELCKVLNDRFAPERTIGVILITGHASMADVIGSLKVGATDFLLKPFTPDHLIQAVRRTHEQVRL